MNNLAMGYLNGCKAMLNLLSTLRRGKTSFTFTVQQFDVPLAPPAKRTSTTEPAPKEGPPLSPHSKAAERKETLQTILASVAKTVCQETQADTITNLTVRLHCSSHLNLNVSIHDGFVHVRQ